MSSISSSSPFQTTVPNEVKLEVLSFLNKRGLQTIACKFDNITKVVQTQVKKTTTDDVQYRTARATSALLGFAKPNLSTHYYPSGQIGYLGNRKIAVFKNTP